MCVLRQSWPVEKCEGFVKRMPGGRILRLNEICKLVLDDPVKAVKWHHKKKKKKGLFGGLGSIQKQEYEEDADEEVEEKKTLEQKLLEEDEQQIMDIDKMNEDDIDLLLEDSVDETSEVDEDEVNEIQNMIEQKKLEKLLLMISYCLK